MKLPASDNSGVYEISHLRNYGGFAELRRGVFGEFLLQIWLANGTYTNHTVPKFSIIITYAWALLTEKDGNEASQSESLWTKTFLQSTIRIHEPVVAQRHTAQAHWSNTELALIGKSFRSVNSSNSWACCGSAAYGTGALESYGALIEKSFRPVNDSNSWACYYSAAYGTGALECGQMTKKSADLDLSISKKSDYDITHLLLLELA